jgi:hypothetical protein
MFPVRYGLTVQVLFVNFLPHLPVAWGYDSVTLFLGK